MLFPASLSANVSVPFFNVKETVSTKLSRGSLVVAVLNFIYPPPETAVQLLAGVKDVFFNGKSILSLNINISSMFSTKIKLSVPSVSVYL